MIRRFFKIFYRMAVVLTGVIFCGSITASAQAGKFIHKPGSELPPPGHNFELRVQLAGIKNSEKKMRAYVVKDGRSLILPLTGHLNEYDQSIYVAETPAPLAQIYYQFILTNDDGTFSSSQRFEITRKCIPDTQLTDAIIKADSDEGNVAQQLVTKTKKLEQEISALHNIIDTIDSLKKELHFEQ